VAKSTWLRVQRSVMLKRGVAGEPGKADSESVAPQLFQGAGLTKDEYEVLADIIHNGDFHEKDRSSSLRATTNSTSNLVRHLMNSAKPAREPQKKKRSF